MSSETKLSENDKKKKVEWWEILRRYSTIDLKKKRYHVEQKISGIHKHICVHSYMCIFQEIIMDFNAQRNEQSLEITDNIGQELYIIVFQY
jgi:hypothetical protein